MLYKNSIFLVELEDFSIEKLLNLLDILGFENKRSSIGNYYGSLIEILTVVAYESKVNN